MNLDVFRNVRPHDRPLVKRVIRRSLVGVALLVLIIVASAFWVDIPKVDRGTPLVTINPPPTHVVWTEVPVGGFYLLNPDPAVRDSAGNTPLLLIPPGSILAVPETVPGEDPDSTRSRT